MTKPRILITAAAGKTGSAATLQLLAQGYPVRAFVRQADQRAHALRKAGDELFVGDMLDVRDLRRAMIDIQRAYYCAPMLPNLLYAGAAFAIAAAEARLETVTTISQWLPHPAHPSVMTRETWLTDQLLGWMPKVDLVTVNPGWFADNYMLVLEPIVHLGLMPMPLGEGLNAPPSNEDIARVVVGTLVNPAQHIGKLYRPTGPTLLSPLEIAAAFERVLQRPVRYQNISEKLLIKALTAQGRNSYQISQLRYYTADYRKNAFGLGAPTNVVQEIGGQVPENFETIIKRYLLNNPNTVRSLQNQLKTLGFFAKMLLTPAPDMQAYEERHHHALLRSPIYATDSEEWRDSHLSSTAVTLEIAGT